ncbi:MAG TPA: ABC transporter ATP-binding protein [Nitrospira sp.]|nr:ABC transporter ATP-binding protein [Nitrospira sp.]
MVQLRQVSKLYRRGQATIAALDEVSLDVLPGEFCAFIGPSGCGKSTMLNLIAGLDHPTSGDIMLDGQSTARFTSRDWTAVRRDSIGIAFQAFHLIAGLSAEENAAFPLMLKGVPRSVIRDRVEEMLSKVGMLDRRRHRPGELSGGEQQRVAVARALVHRPRLVLADEPTGNLDSHHGSAIVDLLRTLTREYHQTVLLVTHSVEAARAADYVWSMKDGRLLSRSPQLAPAAAGC